MNSHRQDSETFKYKKQMQVAVTSDDLKKIHEVKRILRQNRLHTVCEKAKCPNLPECFIKKTATFIILGKSCTRNCAFCAVESSSAPMPVDITEAKKVARAVMELNLKHVVITSVTRDDLTDKGISHFINTVREVKGAAPDTTIEVLTPDFAGLTDRDLCGLVNGGIDIFGHNIEMVKRLYPSLRTKSDYARSLDLLRRIKRLNNDIKTKSAIMLGLGEDTGEVIELLKDVRGTGCDIIVIGQYLKPTPDNVQVERYVSDTEFKLFEDISYKLGFEKVYSFPKARSSYSA